MVWAVPRSLAATGGITICFLFLRVLRWFTSPGCLLPTYGFSWRSSGISLSGLPHSEILGSKPVCGSPKLFAAYHVLHRLLAPRHSPYALSSLTIETRSYVCDTRPKPRAADVRPFALHVLLWSEKTTVCRIFSCKRALKLSAFSCWKAACAASFFPIRVGTLDSTLRPLHERRLVENTGLEPVTSWLQTRRSPS
jgi:hypothetical protein